MSPARIIATEPLTKYTEPTRRWKSKAVSFCKPPQVASWTGQELEHSPEQFVVTLSIRDVQEIENAAQQFAGMPRMLNNELK